MSYLGNLTLPVDDGGSHPVRFLIDCLKAFSSINTSSLSTIKSAVAPPLFFKSEMADWLIRVP